MSPTDGTSVYFAATAVADGGWTDSSRRNDSWTDDLRTDDSWTDDLRLNGS